MDLSKFNLVEQAETPSVLHLCNPVNDEPLVTEDGGNVTLSLLGKDSPVAQAAIKQRTQKQLNKKKLKFDVDELVEASIELLTAVTTGWENISENGTAIEFSKDNAKSLYTRYPWIREQADAFVSDRENFYKA